MDTKQILETNLILFEKRYEKYPSSALKTAIVAYREELEKLK